MFSKKVETFLSQSHKNSGNTALVCLKVNQKAFQPFELDSTNTVSFDWKKNSGTKCTLKIKQINKSYADMFTIHVEIIIVIIFNCTWKK